MKRKLKIIKVIFGVALLIGLISFTVIKNASRTVNKIDVAFVQPVDNYFINDESIREIINKDGKDILKQSLREVNVKEIEQKVSESPFVDSVQVSKDINGHLRLDIKANSAVARIKTLKNEFYLTTKGGKMPLSKLNSADVILVSGDVKPNEYEDLSKFVQALKADDLLKNHIIAIQKVGQRSFNLIVNTGNYYIELGTLNNFEQKLHNLKLFYNQYIDFIGTEDYEKLSLKFVNQVVATKRIKNGEQ
ncbi:FtsQ-type POTRA domain-containing protein [Empedobacter falsenii]|uniref:FtsQ-type POTRA domain-containing protein n=2 Tax=Pseudomonadati TaxID=3379134 RepID=A0A7H9DVI3_9FLAO|nr:cell division protein FtsQ/DivIB [Empedobacter falsenii]HAR73759.1 cell division protein FtsQ [Flavobacteriaceae bacterium]MDM1297748.1 FtsQ-type POTRA domain-containing protein [Empedobacter falsenii]MDM1317622.1 FtsQ-type POTRA domain-containing protein [Empedobacter falsenii]MDM1546402.1 FtsQ-type POTRA domain-containing protein [Empedobacter falsenii]MDM1550164.1 FtsQ-type POTRA domain-containing protein [Empedobacter falsenii]